MRIVSYKYRNKKPFFGRDKKRAAQEKFELGLAELVTSMRMDGVVKNFDDAETIREKVCALLYTCAEIYPNWEGAHQFGIETFAHDKKGGNALIHRLSL